MPEYRVGDALPEPEPETPDGEPYCATCRGARWLKIAGFDPTRRNNDGGLVRCPDCRDGQRTLRLNRLAAMAGLSDVQRRLRFDQLRPVAGIKAAVQAAGAFASKPEGWLVIHGAPGSGKTHISLAVANHLIGRELAVVWRYVPRLVWDLRQQAGSGEPDAITPTLVDAPVLILDDLGAARATDYVIEALEMVFDSRYQRRLPTLVTLIGTPEQVKQRLSVSIGRRMEDAGLCRVVHNAAPQWRTPDGN